MSWEDEYQYRVMTSGKVNAELWAILNPKDRKL
jgi:hypothetical protein